MNRAYKPANIFAGGWSAEKAARLNNVQLPEKTRCKGCHKLKALSQYSNKQLIELRQRVAGPQAEKAKAPAAEIITCRNCTSGQVQELTCILCHQTKSLEEFGKTQRKTPDLARCTICVHEQGLEKWPDREWQEEESDEAFSDEDERTGTVTSNPYESSSYQTRTQVSSISSQLKEVNLAAHNTRVPSYPTTKTGPTVTTHSDLLGSYSDAGFSGGKSDEKGKGKAKENDPVGWQDFAKKAQMDKHEEFTGYDSTGGAHRQVRSPSTVATNDSVEVITDTPRGRREFQQAKGKNSRFAKVDRGPDSKIMEERWRAANVKKAFVGRQVTYSDEEDSGYD
ncbi:MAG: hypothetical protein Q9219_001362 [cf. Caloplaca sp. 3 TL-2023]